MKVGDLVRFKLEHREKLHAPGDPRALYPYKFEIGIVMRVSPYYKYISFPSRPKPATYIEEYVEIVSEAG